MKITKFTKILPIALALSLTVGCAYAEGSSVSGTDENTQSTLNYQLVLEDYIQISASTAETLTSSGTFDADYAGITLTDNMTASFKIISNAPSRTLTLTATNPVAAAPGIGSFSNGNFNLVFAKDGGTAKATDVSNITGGSPTVDGNNDAIAFAVTASNTRSEGPTAGTPFASAFADGVITYTMTNGIETIEYELAKTAVPNTFNTHDSSGTYRATLTLTDHSHSVSP